MLNNFTVGVPGGLFYATKERGCHLEYWGACGRLGPIHYSLLYSRSIWSFVWATRLQSSSLALNDDVHGAARLLGIISQ